METESSLTPPDTDAAVATGNAAQSETAPVYTDMFGENSPPAPFKTLLSARLSLAQINEIMADAYSNKITTTGDSEIPDFGGARKRFAETHQIETGFWVAAKHPGTSE